MPQARFWMAMASENSARGQPNCSAIGIWNSPKLARMPKPTSRIDAARDQDRGEQRLPGGGHRHDALRTRERGMLRRPCESPVKRVRRCGGHQPRVMAAPDGYAGFPEGGDVVAPGRLVGGEAEALAIGLADRRARRCGAPSRARRRPPPPRSRPRAASRCSSPFTSLSAIEATGIVRSKTFSPPSKPVTVQNLIRHRALRFPAAAFAAAPVDLAGVHPAFQRRV